ncbi:MAG: hypothetical protein K1X89_03975 [Myxococcaceae bacterium]|nr:hypothetical protein [Myxococcaceae bacterium]
MLDTLRTAALSNVDDLTTLRIYADALVERGDPDGERILLSIQDEFPREPSAAERVVLGRLRRAVDSCTVFRGLLWDVTLARVTPREFTRLIGRAEWRTVRTIHFLRGVMSTTQRLPPWECAQLVSHPVMEALRVVTGFDLRALQLLGERTKPVPLEGINVLCHHAEVGLEGPLSALPALRRLAVNGCSEAALAALVAGPFWPQLRVLELDFARGRVPSNGLSRLLLGNGALEYLQYGPCSAVRDADGWSLTIDGTAQWIGPLLVDLESAGHLIARATVVNRGLEDATRAAVEDAARRFHWELHLDEVPLGYWYTVGPEPDF